MHRKFKVFKLTGQGSVFYTAGFIVGAIGGAFVSVQLINPDIEMDSTIPSPGLN